MKAGFDFEKLMIDVDDEKKTIMVLIPEIKITDIVVDIASLDYIFMNEKANTGTVVEEAYKKCIEDVQNESNSGDAIYSLARENAKNVLKALIAPFIEQSGEDYELVINTEGVNEKNN